MRRPIEPRPTPDLPAPGFYILWGWRAISAALGVTEKTARRWLKRDQVPLARLKRHVCTSSLLLHEWFQGVARQQQYEGTPWNPGWFKPGPDARRHAGKGKPRRARLNSAP